MKIKLTKLLHTIPTILKRINAQNSIITWDALNTQKSNIEAVCKSKADYVVPIKSNHSNFYNDLNLYFDDKRLDMIKAGDLNTAYSISSEKANSSIITYEYFQTEDIKWYHDYKAWKNLHTIGLIKRL